MNEQPELRRDPITGRWVLIAPARARRPIALTGHAPHARTNGERFPCPFCAGQEADTPNEVFAYREPGSPPNGPGWSLRIVPNMYPAVQVEPAEFVAISAASFLESALAVGYAEVLIDCPQHIDNPTQLSDAQFRDVFRAYRERMRALAADARLAHVAVFKNVGAEAGASLGHSHSQLISTPIVPELLRKELTGAEEYHRRRGRCVYCDMLERELADGARVVARSEHFVALTAFAPRFAYELWILPLGHQPRYEAIADSEALEVAVLLKRVLRSLDDCQHLPAYNWFLHTTPLREGEPPYYHWHLELTPRTSRPAGFEWGFGCHITTIAPEVAAEQLRAALPPS